MNGVSMKISNNITGEYQLFAFECHSEGLKMKTQRYKSSKASRIAIGSISALAGLVLTACGGSTVATQTESTTSATPSTESGDPSIPVVGECFDYPDMDHWVLTDKPVDCDTSHTAMTVFVGQMPTGSTVSFAQMETLKKETKAAGGFDSLSEPEQADWQAQNAQFDTSDLFEECRTVVNGLVNGVQSPGVTRISRFSTDVTGPNQAQWDSGARWVRCNVASNIGSAANNELRLQNIPANLDGIMESRDGARFNNCYTNHETAKNPKSDTRQASCTSADVQAHGWWNVLSVKQDVNAVWQGKSAAQSKIEATCLSELNKVMSSTWDPSHASSWFFYRDAVSNKASQKPTKESWTAEGATFTCATWAEDISLRK